MNVQNEIHKAFNPEVIVGECPENIYIAPAGAGVSQMCRQQVEKLESLKNQIAYIETALSDGDPAPWARKEYKETLESLKVDLAEQQAHIDYLKEEGLI